jgi:hypothetical protein
VNSPVAITLSLSEVAAVLMIRKFSVPAALSVPAVLARAAVRAPARMPALAPPTGLAPADVNANPVVMMAARSIVIATTGVLLMVPPGVVFAIRRTANARQAATFTGAAAR